MTITFRQYGSIDDFERVSEFLWEHYQPHNQDGNWLQPTWEYMHSHPALDEASLHKIRIWEDNGEIVAVVHYESVLGEVFFELHPEYTHLKSPMLDYAEAHLYGKAEDDRRFVYAFINDFDKELEALVSARGYEKNTEGYIRPMSRFTIPDLFPPISLPEGFRLKSLAEDNDLRKIHRVLWRGFNHPGEPPEDELEDRRKMQSTPNYRKDLVIVVEAPNGNFVSFSGTWYDDENKLAYVEPVATDPDFRRMGLGKAAVLEGVRRCGELGATVAFVGSDQAFYKAIGFEKLFDTNCWVKYLD